MASELSQFIDKELKSHGVENDEEEKLLADLRMKPLTVESSQPPGFLKRYRNVFLILGGVIVIALILVGSGSYYATTRNTDLSNGKGKDVKKMPPMDGEGKRASAETKETKRREDEDDDEYDEYDYEDPKRSKDEYMHGDGMEEEGDDEYEYDEAPGKDVKKSGKDQEKKKEEKKKEEKKKVDEDYEDYDYAPDTPTPEKE